MGRTKEMAIAMAEAEETKHGFIPEYSEKVSKEIPEYIKKKLKEPLPLEALKPHPTKSFLTVINPAYVVERLNDAFGIGGWNIRSRVISQDTEHIVVQAMLSIPDYGIVLEAFGGNKNDDLGDSYKGAQTDALTKAASYLGIGLDIYKGLGPKLNVNNQEKKEDKPWLNTGTDNYTAVVKALKEGFTIEQVKKKYRLSKKIENELLQFYGNSASGK